MLIRWSFRTLSCWCKGSRTGAPEAGDTEAFAISRTRSLVDRFRVLKRLGVTADDPRFGERFAATRNGELTRREVATLLLTADRPFPAALERLLGMREKELEMELRHDGHATTELLRDPTLLRRFLVAQQLDVLDALPCDDPFALPLAKRFVACRPHSPNRRRAWQGQELLPWRV